MTDIDWQAVRLLNYVHLLQLYRIIQISAPPHSNKSTILPTDNNVDSTVHFSFTYFRKSLPNLCRRCPGYPSCFHTSRPKRRPMLLKIAPLSSHSFQPQQSLRCKGTSKYHSIPETPLSNVISKPHSNLVSRDIVMLFLGPFKDRHEISPNKILRSSNLLTTLLQHPSSD
jgi:hypothetical protein